MTSPQPNPHKLNDRTIVRSWYMFDWANSVYALVISSAIFPIYYQSVTTVNGSKMVSFMDYTIDNSVLFTYALSLSFLIVAVMLPLLSGMADYSGKKKSFMKFFVWLGSLACIGLYFFTDVSVLWWGLLCAMIASIGYSGSLVFYDAFLPEIVTADRYDKTSARGYAAGYYGGVVLMLICLLIIMNPGSFGFVGDKPGMAATRFSFILTGLWWLGFSLIPFKHLPTSHLRKSSAEGIWKNGYQEIRKVWRGLALQPDLRRYLIAFFCYNSGVQTVMYLAALFGSDVLHLKDDQLIATILIIQLVGAFGAWLSAKISAVHGNRWVLMIMNMIWIGVCVGAYLTQTDIQFYVLAVVVGMIMGGIQSLSRATYSKLIPEDTTEHASYFSFYDVAFNLSIVLGTFSYGLINHLTGDMRYSALFLSVYFIAGGGVLMSVRSVKIQCGIIETAN